MTNKIPLTIRHKTEDGQRLAYVPIRGGEDKHCTMYEDDFNALLAMGMHPVFRLKQGTIFCRCNCRNVGVARLLCNCQPGENVRYLNADPTDLRPINLLKLPGMARYAARSQLQKTLPTLRYELEHVYED
jgi:hypothetical protein